MGSIPVNNIDGEDIRNALVKDIQNPSLTNGHVNVLSDSIANGDSFRAFQVAGLESDRTSSVTGMRDEILLLSWVIVLLRSREDGQVSFDWAYKCMKDGSEVETEIKSLSTTEIITGLKDSIAKAAAAISLQIVSAPPNENQDTRRTHSLLLSTNSLSETPRDAKEEGILHLEICLTHNGLEIRPVWYNKNMPEHSVTKHIETLVDTIQLCLSNLDASIEESLQLVTRDLDEIWRWNHTLPPTYDYCMHDMISEKSQKYLDKIAISSWDGDLTYGQIEQYSTYLANSLQEMGVELHDFLPVCFEKSKWTIVAVLAVMKAGATLVLMDPTLPLVRLQNMAEQVGAKAMLASRKQYDLSTSIILGGQFIVVEEETFSQLSDSQDFPGLATVPPSALMYIIFTSGSTGTPKGVKISHQTYTSSAIPRAKAVGYNEDSRVLDFASYAFDVSIDSMFLTLGNGGCLCIPSDDDRLNDINGAIRKMQVNYAGITPSVARILDADVIASLSGLGLGGEAASARDVTLWGQDTRIIIGYGPCECTIGCTVNSSAATGRDYISIGPGNGAAIWIADANNHESLVPVGAVGELLVEGPIVGQGYLNDPDKTAAAFINDPSWLVSGHRNYAGRRGRLYKTGDLGRYDPDGSGGIIFVGRKDTQVKLRGQRVELGEIESQLKARLPSETNVIAEVIVPQASGGQPTLVAFISAHSSKQLDNTDPESAQLPDELRRMLSEADTELATVLPRYMVPTAYIPVNYIPSLISGKTDRKRLRQFGATVDLRQLEQDIASTAPREINEPEKRLRHAWSQTLKFDEEAIRYNDNFFALGGDSLAAMRLVSVCRTQGFDLTVTNIFGHPTLSDMAGVINIKNVQQELAEVLPFSLISTAAETTRVEASNACGSTLDAIEDVYPCTPTQESLFTFSIKSTEPYVAQRIACIPDNITLDSWKKAWEDVVSATPILRSRVAQLQQSGLQQVVIKENIAWKMSTNLAKHLKDDKNERMNLGQRLARYAIIGHPEDGKRYMVWTVHHVLYDGWSEPIILEQIRNVLQSQQLNPQTQMLDFVKYVRDTNEADMQEFWRRELKGAVGPQFPRLPSRDYMPTPDGFLEHQMSFDGISGSTFTLATLIRGAWALVASQYTGSDDVVFGETLTGRDIPLPDVESIVGPLIATVPIRVRIDRRTSVEKYLQTVQQAMMARTPYQHAGMQNIRKVSQDAQHACEAGTGLVIQPEPDHVARELGFEVGDAAKEALHFNPYPLMLAFGIQKGGFRVCASFDSSLVGVTQMERILAQLEVTFLRLTQGPSMGVNEISCLPAAELNQIWRWNETPPLSPDESSGKLRADAGIKYGATYPRAVTPWVCDSRNPALLSPIGCAGELWFEGAYLSGDVIDSPSWLVAGSSMCVGRRGRVQSTGDIVQLREDGSLVFVGRKEDVIPVGGHAVDIAELESQFTRLLPPTVRAAATVFQAANDTGVVPEQELVVFVEQELSVDDTVTLMSSKYHLPIESSDPQSFETTLPASISPSLAASLKKLDKFIHDSLTSLTIPSAYIIVSSLPISPSHSSLSRLAARIPSHIIAQLRHGMKTAWAKLSTEANLTSAEAILRASWSTILGIDPAQIDVDDNFFRLGGDSVMAMKLVSRLRAQGHGLSVADIFKHMRLGDAARVLKVDVHGTKLETAQKAYEAFSTLDTSEKNIDDFLSTVVRPQLAYPNWQIQDVYPVTDTQAIDIHATVNAPRTSVQYTMLNLSQSVDRSRLLSACADLIATHDILRTVFIPHGTSFLQVILASLDTPVVISQATTPLESHITALCASDIEGPILVGASFLKFFFVESTAGDSCLVLRLSHAQYDGYSLPHLLNDLERLYSNVPITSHVSFSRYVYYTLSPLPLAAAKLYWTNLLLNSALSPPPFTPPPQGEKALFRTRSISATPPSYITIATILSTAWALTLARRLRTRSVVFGAVTIGRALSQVEGEPFLDSAKVMGPCYQLTPLLVTFSSGATASEALLAVQRQSAESTAFDYLGFKAIAETCTVWTEDRTAEGFEFGSIVHHQDWDDYDEMPFAGGKCKVDIANPHGDAASPVKVVSFVKQGVMHVGVVAGESQGTEVEALLGELASAVEELSGEGEVVVEVMDEEEEVTAEKVAEKVGGGGLEVV